MLFGGMGNDTYVLENGTDVIIDSGGGDWSPRPSAAA